jgi:hypothetical protein
LVWQTHYEFTDVYHQFSHRFLGKLLDLNINDKLKMKQKKYEFTLAEYERTFLKEPEKEIWQPLSERFNEKLGGRVYVNIKKI